MNASSHSERASANLSALIGLHLRAKGVSSGFATQPTQVGISQIPNLVIRQAASDPADTSDMFLSIPEGPVQHLADQFPLRHDRRKIDRTSITYIDCGFGSR